MKRRPMLVGLGTAALVASGKLLGQERARPLVGLLGGRSPQTDGHLLSAFLEGLDRVGYADERNIQIAYRWANGLYDRLPALAAELVRLNPALIVAAGGSAVALAVKASTTSIPVVFAVGGDPVALGLVSDMARPRGNMTGVTTYSAALDAKRLELLRDIAPSAKVLAVLINPGNPNADSELGQARIAAKSLGQSLHVFSARTDAEIGEAMRAIGQLRPDALAVASDSFLIARRARIVALVAELRLPAIYAVREFAEAGGLMSYGTNFADMYRQLGTYAGQVLKGAQPSSLPVQQPTRYELVLNLNTARALGMTVAPSILIRATQVIE